jgi:hypothetical protein
MKRDARGCRVYANIEDANGAMLIVKQATVFGGQNHGLGRPTDRLWLFLERHNSGGSGSTPLLTPDATRALIAALQLHLKHMNDGPDTTSPLDMMPDAADAGPHCALCLAAIAAERIVRVPRPGLRSPDEVPVQLCAGHYRHAKPENLLTAARRLLRKQKA